METGGVVACKSACAEHSECVAIQFDGGNCHLKGIFDQTEASSTLTPSLGWTYHAGSGGISVTMATLDAGCPTCSCWLRTTGAYGAGPAALSKAVIHASAENLVAGTKVSAIGDLFSQSTSSRQPTVVAAASPTGLPGMSFDGGDYLEDASIAANSGSMHWFWAMKAETGHGWHNVMDAFGGAMCLWINGNNKYELNNCAGTTYDTIRSTTNVGEWQVVQASVVDSATNILNIDVADPAASTTQTVAYGDTMGTSAKTYELFNRNGGNIFHGIVGEMVVINDDLTTAEQDEIRLHLVNKWIRQKAYADCAAGTGWESFPNYCVSETGSDLDQTNTPEGDVDIQACKICVLQGRPVVHSNSMPVAGVVAVAS